MEVSYLFFYSYNKATIDNQRITFFASIISLAPIIEWEHISYGLSRHTLV